MKIAAPTKIEILAGSSEKVQIFEKTKVVTNSERKQPRDNFDLSPIYLEDTVQIELEDSPIKNRPSSIESKSSSQIAA